jgi:hypothetical protein
MIPDNADLWDAAALNAVLAYKGGAKQAWDNTELRPVAQRHAQFAQFANLGI